MRCNDKELIKFGENQPDLEGLLHHMRPQTKDWSDWYQQPQFKERYFKLKANLLYYYRVNEQEPLGILVLENAQVAYERPHKGIPFAFSLTFKINDKLTKDVEDKHIFSCRCESDVNKWVSSLKVHSYEYWRSQYVILKTKISMKTGQDPVLDYMIREGLSPVTERRTEVKTTKKTKKKSTFCSHVESSFYNQTTVTTKTDVNYTSKNTPVSVDNLIEL